MAYSVLLEKLIARKLYGTEKMLIMASSTKGRGDLAGAETPRVYCIAIISFGFPGEQLRHPESFPNMKL